MGSQFFCNFSLVRIPKHGNVEWKSTKSNRSMLRTRRVKNTLVEPRRSKPLPLSSESYSRNAPRIPINRCPITSLMSILSHAISNFLVTVNRSAKLEKMWKDEKSMWNKILGEILQNDFFFWFSNFGKHLRRSNEMGCEMHWKNENLNSKVGILM